ncbi:uncharacterized protein LOC121859830, partial [Homarus americanus]|uniref:uncharacterized protein LOC121859830 n=1 Tax=Homarus americanus TaxID=6706 RepID=UPI001C45A9A2
MTTPLLMVLLLAVTVAQLPLPYGRSETRAVVPHKWLATLLTTASTPQCSMFFFTDGKTFGITVFTDFMDQFRDPCGVGLFEVAVDGQDANVTKAQLSRVVDEARR